MDHQLQHYTLLWGTASVGVEVMVLIRTLRFTSTTANAWT